MLEPIATAEIPLPAGATGEVVFALVSTEPGYCGYNFIRSPGIIIDDLRVE